MLNCFVLLLFISLCMVWVESWFEYVGAMLSDADWFGIKTSAFDWFASAVVRYGFIVYSSRKSKSQLKSCFFPNLAEFQMTKYLKNEIHLCIYVKSREIHRFPELRLPIKSNCLSSPSWNPIGLHFRMIRPSIRPALTSCLNRKYITFWMSDALKTLLFCDFNV